MQTYPLKLTAASSQAMFPAHADLFVYESGTSAQDARILVKPDSGGEIALRPGQRFRLPPGEKAQQWLVRSFATGAVIDGTIIIGSGDFDDANTNNIVTLSEGFSNNVRVNNTTAERVPVTLDTAQTIPVSLSEIRVNNTTAQRIPVTLDPAQVLNTSEGVLSYNKSAANNSALNANVPVALVTAAENLNGAILRMFRQSIVGSNGAVSVLIAKATAPASVTDGDVLASMMYSATVPSYESAKQIVVPAGKAIWAMSTANETGAFRNVLVTLL